MQRSRSITGLLGDGVAAGLLRRIRRRAGKVDLFRGVVVPVDDLIGQRVISTGMFEATHIDGALGLLSAFPRLRDGRGLFVDVGANIGLYSIALSPHFRRGVAIEANPQTFKVLEANLALKGLDRVSAFCVGASDGPGEASIHIPLNGNLGWATLDPDHHKLPLKELPIRLRTVDDILAELDDGPVRLMKVDVEGHEVAVLRGARAMLARDRPVVLFEVLDADAGRASAAMLRECGYRRFFGFKRGWPAAGGRIASVWRGLRTGLPVNLREIDAADLHHAALVCAIAGDADPVS